MAKIKIDEELCIGCGLCAELCPKTFEMKGDKAKVKKAELNNADCEKDAADSCPTSAIKII